MPLNRQRTSEEWDEVPPHGTICSGLSSSSCEPGKSSEGLCVGGEGIFAAALCIPTLKTQSSQAVCCQTALQVGVLGSCQVP